MGNYFNTWRRKGGVLTLLMACLLAGFWLRSFTETDGFDYVSEPWDILTITFDSHSQHVFVYLKIKNLFARNFVITYRSIVIPLTLLSAWLLLSKPRLQKTPEKRLEKI